MMAGFAPPTPARAHGAVPRVTRALAPARPTTPLGNQAALRRLSAVPPRVQARLQIGAVDDPLEREADVVADSVVGAAAAPALAASAARVSRKCAACEEEEAGTARMKPATPVSAASPGPVPPQVQSVIGSPGRPLDAGSRAFFEPRFGQDFGAVRVHDDAAAGSAAAAIGARAFAVGEHVAFAAGAFDGGSGSGRRLLAHELAHVVQQRGGASAQTLRRAAPEKPCDPLSGPPAQPEHVGRTLLDRLEGKYASIDKDPGEGCKPAPYPAASGEGVCTVGYGHQIPGCTLLDAATNAPPTGAARAAAKQLEVRDPVVPGKEPKKRAARPGEWLTCKCSAPIVGCPDEADALLKKDISGSGEKFVHDQIRANLDEAKFNALVDLVLHHGSIDKSYIDEIHKYGCSDEGWDYLREEYLHQNLTPEKSNVVSQAFVNRRRLRAWPVAAKTSSLTCGNGRADPNTCTEQNEL